MKRMYVQYFTGMLAAVLLCCGSVQAQQSDGTVNIKLPAPLLAYADPTMCSYCMDTSSDIMIDGELHISVRSHRDENGCMQYTIEHNWNTVTFHSQQVSLPEYRGCAYTTPLQTVTYCDDEACEIAFTLTGSLDLTGMKGNDCILNQVMSYEITYKWNRCTDTWTVTFQHCTIECS